MDKFVKVWKRQRLEDESHGGESAVVLRSTHPFAHCSIRLNPTETGQCQFASVSDQLSTIDIMVSPEELRSNVVSFLSTQPFTGDGTHMQQYVSVDWDVYLEAMADTRTYGDHLTLIAAAKIYNVQFVVMSSIGASGTRIVSTDATGTLRHNQPILLLGHYAETGSLLKEHYGSLNWEGTGDLTEFIHSAHQNQLDHQHPQAIDGDDDPIDDDAVSFSGECVTLPFTFLPERHYVKFGH